MLKIFNLQNMNENLISNEPFQAIRLNVGGKKMFISPNKQLANLDDLSQAGLALTTRKRIIATKDPENNYAIIVYKGAKICSMYIDYRTIEVLDYTLSQSRDEFVLICRIKSYAQTDMIILNTEDKKKNVISVIDGSVTSSDINVEKMNFKSIRIKKRQAPIARLKLLITSVEHADLPKDIYDKDLPIDDGSLPEFKDVNFYIYKDEYNVEEIDKLKNKLHESCRLYEIISAKDKNFRRINLNK